VCAGVEFEEAQRQVRDLLRGRVLVGHALERDFEVLHLSHPPAHTRDTSTYVQNPKCVC
jgi:DNA polymerase III epsilon subunit-like protein